MTAQAGPAEEPIAIIGIACRLPQADGPEEFWRLLHESTDAVTDVPDGRWPAGPAGQDEYRRGGFLADIDGFDAAFFGITAREAAAMDPQQRLTLELAWEALEHARIVPAELRGSAAGIFVGAISTDYAALRDRLGPGGLGPHAYTGAHRAIIANRVSYVLGLRGPSLTLDTGQSSSLVAVQLACESLRRGESTLALAGGVNLNLLAETTAAIGSFGALSPDGRCHVFDAAANGYVRGEGGALVVLKPLTGAQRDGDPVLSVILGGAVNNDGGGDGLTAPTAEAQHEVIRLAVVRAAVEPGDVQYVELHGTGTRVGDPIEASALGAALTQDRTEQRPLLVGSVKTNIGHLEGAAGIAGLVKVALSIAHGELPATLHHTEPNPDIPLGDLRLRVVTERQSWPSPHEPRVAGISSFGMGGTNCHLVLGPAPTPAPPAGDPADTTTDSAIPWVLSAKSAGSLRAQAQRLHAAHTTMTTVIHNSGADQPGSGAGQLGAGPDQLGSGPDQLGFGAGQLAVALARTRTTHDHRAVILADAPADRRAALNALATAQPSPDVVTGTARPGRRVFTFPGQGSQWTGMARDLLASNAEFAGLIDQCAQALAPFTDFSLTDVIAGVPGAPGFDRVDVVQPALWAVMVSLAGLWRAHGVEPDAVIGHSQGEIAAATVAGALSLSDGAKVVALRSRIIGELAASGGMMSVAGTVTVVEEAIAALAPRATVAAVNGPRSVVVSGTVADLEKLHEHLTGAGHRAKVIPVDYASHSRAVEPLRDPILAALIDLQPRPAQVAFVSALTGRPIDTTGLDAAYWYCNLRHPVRFGRAVKVALAAGCGLFVECSPHPVLVGAVEEVIDVGQPAAGQPTDTSRPDASPFDAAAVGTLRRAHGGETQFRRALAEAWTHGAPVDWARGHDQPRAVLPALPTYAFDRRPYPLATVTPSPTATGHPTPTSAMTVGIHNPDEAEPATTPRTRHELATLVLTTIAGLLGHDDPAAITPSRTFKDLGVDSAVGIELRNQLRSALGRPLPAGLVFDYPTPAQLIDRLHTLTAGGEGGPAAAPEPQPARPTGHLSGPANTDLIAIVGVGCRYPGGIATPEDLWELVIGSGEAITEFPVNRGWDLGALLNAEPGQPGSSDTRYGGFLHDADQFDAAFFGISPREAAAMDPQQRLLLEVCWEAAEHAGLDPHALRGTRTGVFAGAMAPEYGPRLHQASPGADGHRLTGTLLSVVSGRIAYTFGLEGPAVTVDTACSSSLVAVHLAAQALRRGECELALAGGVTVMSSPGIFVEFSRQHGLSEDGRCKAFSAAADGTGWAEGAGVLLLERLSDARQNGHRVLALVRGSAVNQDGHSNGLTAPNGPSQERVIADALRDAGLTPQDVQAVEAHGTGTTLGDPIEARALINAYGQGRPEGQPLWLGSIKSNIGHTQAAAGVAGLIKMAMAMRHRTLPPTLHASEPTPHVDWSAGQVRLLTEPVPWPGESTPAIAAVSSFGVSGTNAHVIIEAPRPSPSPHGRRVVFPAQKALVWVLSARSIPALRSHAARLLDYAVTAAADELPAAGAALLRRARFGCRAVVVAADRDELLAALAALANGTPHPCVTEGNVIGEPDDVRPVFVFPGQGSQWAGMAAELMDDSAVFRAEIERCDAAFAPHTGWSVIDVLRGTDDSPELAGSDVIQPVLFAVMVSLAAVWRAAGVDPAAVIGHSQGEIAAACSAGALPLPEAARIVALRSKALMTLTGTGGMIALAKPAGQVREMLARWPDRLWVAIESGPQATVLAGDTDALAEFTAAYGDTERLHRVAIDYAAHTPHIEALREELLAILDGVTPQPASTEICSSLTGEPIEPAELTADYWFRGLRHPVRFTQAVAALTGSGSPLFIEVSPHPVLTGYVQDTLRETESPGGAVGSLRRNAGGLPQLLKSAAQAFVLGAPINWPALTGPSGAPPVELPGYPFERRRYWLDGEPAQAPAGASGLAASAHPLLRASAPLAGSGGHLLTGELSRTTMPWLTDHEVDGAVLLPGTAFAELAIQAAQATGCTQIDELIIEAPLILPATGAVALQILVTPPDDTARRTLTIHSRPAPDPAATWTRHASATLSLQTAGGWMSHSPHQRGEDVTSTPLASGPLGAWPPADSTPVELDGVYERLAAHGYHYGPAFQGLVKAWRSAAGGGVEVTLPDQVRPAASQFALHPALLDAALHDLVLASLPEAGDAEQADTGLLLPFSWSGLRVLAPGAGTLRVTITRLDDNQVALDCYDAAGQPIAQVGALTLRRVRRTAPPAAPAGPTLQAATWTAISTPQATETDQRWAVIGCDDQAERLAVELGAVGADVAHYYDLPSLADMTGGDLPDHVIATVCATSTDVPAAIRQTTTETLDLIQAWLGDDRYAGHRLIVATSSAHDEAPPATGQASPQGQGPQAGAPAAALAGAAIHGLVRSAMREHPGRFGLLGLDPTTTPAMLAAALATAEDELRIHDGTILTPSLTPASTPATPTPATPASALCMTTGIHSAGEVGEGTVLVTGGTGGLGALVAQHLAERHGVSHLLLVSRRGPQAPGADALVSRLTELGAQVTVAACDVSDRAELAALLDAIPAGHELAGVVHAAGTLDDATVEGLSARHLDTVLRPKADAAWHLHELTRELPVGLFVLFSSVAGLLGTQGQANYAAANAVLDRLALARREAGLPATSIAWGPWAVEASMTGHLTEADLARLSRAGLAPLPASDGLTLLDAALAAPEPCLVAAQWQQPGSPEAGRPGVDRTGHTDVPAPSQSTPGPEIGGGNLIGKLAAQSRDDGLKLLVDLVRGHVAAVLAYPNPDAVDVDRAVSELGFDSLTAVELRNRLDAATGLRLSATLAFDHPTVTALAGHLHRVLAPAPPPPEDTLRAALDQVQQAWPDPDDTTRRKITAILHSALARWDTGARTVGDPAGSDNAAKISSASDDEIFAFIDNEF